MVVASLLFYLTCTYNVAILCNGLFACKYGKGQRQSPPNTELTFVVVDSRQTMKCLYERLFSLGHFWLDLEKIVTEFILHGYIA